MFKIDSQRLISFANNNTQVWSLKDGKSLASLDVKNFDGSLISFATLVQIDNQSIALGTTGEYDRLIIWNIENYQVLHNISNDGNLDTLVKLLDGRLATRRCCDCFILFDITTRLFKKFCQSGNDNVVVLNEFHDGSILSGSSSGYLTRNFLSLNTSHILQKHNASITHIEILKSKFNLLILFA
jgi:hypothetical protein